VVRKALLAIAVGIGSLFAAYAAPAKKKATDRPATSQNSNVDLNTASAKDLDTLPGVGPATAKKIIDHRPYQSVDDLYKAGLSSKEIDRIRKSIVVSKPANIPAPARPTATDSARGQRPVPHLRTNRLLRGVRPRRRDRERFGSTPKPRCTIAKEIAGTATRKMGHT
jgi:hypothetical protein